MWPHTHTRDHILCTRNKKETMGLWKRFRTTIAPRRAAAADPLAVTNRLDWDSANGFVYTAPAKPASVKVGKKRGRDSSLSLSPPPQKITRPLVSEYDGSLPKKSDMQARNYAELFGASNDDNAPSPVSSEGLRELEANRLAYDRYVPVPEQPEQPRRWWTMFGRRKPGRKEWYEGGYRRRRTARRRHPRRTAHRRPDRLDRRSGRYALRRSRRWRR